jgi:hypothetical protein
MATPHGTYLYLRHGGQPWRDFRYCHLLLSATRTCKHHGLLCYKLILTFSVSVTTFIFIGIYFCMLQWTVFAAREDGGQYHYSCLPVAATVTACLPSFLCNEEEMTAVANETAVLLCVAFCWHGGIYFFPTSASAARLPKTPCWLAGGERSWRGLPVATGAIHIRALCPIYNARSAW